MNVLAVVRIATVPLDELEIGSQLCRYGRHEFDELRTQRLASRAGFHLVKRNNLLPTLRKNCAVNVVDETNAKKVLGSCRNRLKDTFIAVQPNDPAPLQTSHANDGQQQSCRSCRHPANAVRGNKSWALLAEPAPHRRDQFRRRLFCIHGMLYGLFHAQAAFKNSGAFRARVQVLEHVLVCLDDKFVIEIRVEIPPISLARSFIKVNHVHKHPLSAFCLVRLSRHSSPVSFAIVFGHGSIGTSLSPREYPASPQFLCMKTPARPTTAQPPGIPAEFRQVQPACPRLECLLQQAARMPESLRTTVPLPTRF